MNCQQRVDAKAFTGRGVHRAVAAAAHDVDSIVSEMERLVRLSKERPAALIYLCMHKRPTSGQVSLRWRERVTTRHVPWLELRKRLKGAHSNEREWYLAVDLKARELNEREKDARRQLLVLRQQARLAEAVGAAPAQRLAPGRSR
jgi:hypothetical protein